MQALSRASRLLRVVAAVLVVTATVATATPGEDQVDLQSLDLQELLDLEVVVGASRHEQTTREAPATVTILTAQEIADFGWRTLAEALRSAHGLHVSYDRNYSYVGVRGFFLPGDYNSRMLLLLDGQRLNDNVYDGALIGSELPVDLDMIERIEIVRGPGSALYGSSALLAVVNLVTRQGKDVGGARLAAEGGSLGAWAARARVGARERDGLDYAISAAVERRDGADLIYPEFSGDASRGVTRGTDSDRSAKFLGRVSMGDWSFRALHGSRTKGIPTASYGSRFADPAAATSDSLTILSARRDATLHRDFQLVTEASFYDYDYRGRYPFAGNPATLLRDGADGAWLGLDAMITYTRPTSHLLSAGFEYRWHFRQDQFGHGTAAGEELSGFDHRARSTTAGVFVQDEWRPWTRLTVVGGVRYDHHPASGGALSPRLGLLLSADANTTVKLLYGRAFRAPNRYESDSNPELNEEHLETLELAAERQVSRILRVSVTAYRFVMRDLIAATEDPNDANLVVFTNRQQIHSDGITVELEARGRRGVALRTSWTWQGAHEAPGDRPLAASPRHLGKLNLSAPLWRDQIRGALELQYTGSRSTLGGSEVPGFVLANLTLRAPELPSGFDLSLSVYNLFDRDYADPASIEHVQDAIGQDGRTLRVVVGKSF